MKNVLLLLVCSFTFALNAHSQTMLELLTEELTSFDMIQDDTMFSGEGGTGKQFTPEVAQVYFNFLEAASISDLKELINHENPIVACYSYRGLLDKGYNQIVPILDEFQGDIKVVEWVSDDIIEMATCYQWMLQRTKFHLQYKGLKLDPKEKAAFEKLVDEEHRRIHGEVIKK